MLPQRSALFFGSLLFVVSGCTADPPVAEAYDWDQFCPHGVWEGDFEVYPSYMLDREDVSFVEGDFRSHGCHTVQGDVYVKFDVDDISVLRGLETIGGNLIISQNSPLSDLDPLSSLTTIDGNLVLDENPSLTSIGGFKALTSLGASLFISSNQGLTNLDGLNGLNGIGGHLVVLDHEQLTDIDALAGLSFVPGDVVVAYNGTSFDLAGLSSITSVGGDVVLFGQSSFEDLNDLGSLQTIGGQLFIDDPALSSLAGLTHLEAVGEGITIGAWAPYDYDATGIYEVLLGGHSPLPQPKAPPPMGTVNGGIEIWGSELTDVDGLKRLTTVAGDLTVVATDSLQDLDGLAQLASVSGDVWIQQNYGLNSLQGLYALSQVGGESFAVVDNPSLPSCEAWLVAGHLKINGFAGTVDIYLNGIGGCL